MAKHFFALCALLAHAALCGCSAVELASAAHDTNQVQPHLELAPDFILLDRDGTERSLATERGKVQFLSFSAPWCFLCKIEAQRLEFLQQQIGADRLAVLLVATFDLPQRLSEFAGKTNNFPVVIDSRGKVAHDYNVATLPATFIIGLDGEFLPLSSESSYRFDGMIDWGASDKVEAVDKLVSSLLPR